MGQKKKIGEHFEFCTDCVACSFFGSSFALSQERVDVFENGVWKWRDLLHHSVNVVCLFVFDFCLMHDDHIVIYPSPNLISWIQSEIRQPFCAWLCLNECLYVEVREQILLTLRSIRSSSELNVIICSEFFLIYGYLLLLLLLLGHLSYLLCYSCCYLLVVFFLFHKFFLIHHIATKVHYNGIYIVLLTFQYCICMSVCVCFLVNWTNNVCRVILVLWPRVSG